MGPTWGVSRRVGEQSYEFIRHETAYELIYVCYDLENRVCFCSLIRAKYDAQ